MLLRKRESRFGANPQSIQSQIDNANTLGDLTKVLEEIVKLGSLAKYSPDFTGRTRFILSRSENQFDYDVLDQFFYDVEHIAFYQNPFFKSKPMDTITFFRDMSKLVSDREILPEIVDGVPSALFGICPPFSQSIDFIESSAERERLFYEDFLKRIYVKLINAILPTKGIPFSSDVLREAFERIEFQQLMRLSSKMPNGTAKVDVVGIVYDILHDDDLHSYLVEKSEECEDLMKEDEVALKSGLMYLHDIWDNFSTVGLEILKELYDSEASESRENDMRDFLFNLSSSLKGDQIKGFDDLVFLARNFDLALRRNIKFVKRNDVLEMRLGNLEEELYFYCSVYYHQNVQYVPEELLLSAIRSTFLNVASMNPALKDHMDELRVLIDAAMTRMKKEKYKTTLDYDTAMILGMLSEPEDFVEDEPVEESVKRTVQKTIGGLKKGAAGAKSVGLSVGHAFNVFNRNRKQIEGQMDKGMLALKDLLFGTNPNKARTAIVEGKKFSFTGLVKKLLGLVCLFSFGKVKAILFLIVRAVMKGKVKKAERRKLIMEIEEELQIIEEKISDASADGDRKAKYQLMRTRSELQNALERIKYGYSAEAESDAVNAMNKSED